MSCAGVGAVSAVIYLYARTMLRTVVAPFVLAAVPPLIPTAPREALGTMNNLHSFLLLAIPFALLFVPRSWWSSAATAALVAIIVLSETQALLFAPLLLAEVRSPRKWPVIAAFLGAGIAQSVTFVQFPRSAIDYGTTTSVGLGDVIVGFITVPLSTVWTTRLDVVAHVITHAGIAPFVLLAAACVVAAVIAIILGSGPHRWLVSATVLGAAAIWAAALLVTPAASFAFTQGIADHVAAFGTIRYATVSSGLLLVALVVVADALWGKSWIRRGFALAITMAVAAPLVANFHDSGHARRDDGPTITSQIPAAREECEAGDSTDALLRQSPDRPPWTVTLSCAYLDHR